MSTEQRDALLKNLKLARKAIRARCDQEFIRLTRKIDSDFAYVLGVVLGDGYTTFQKNGNAHIGLSVIDKDFAVAFRNALENWSNKRCYFKKYKDRWRVMLTSISATKAVEDFKRKGRYNFDGVLRQRFLRGLFDSEGNISEKRRRIRFYNSKTELIGLVKKLLQKEGVNKIVIYKRRSEIHTIGGVPYKIKPIYCLEICLKRNLHIFHNNIGLSIERKRKKLDDILNSYMRTHIPWSELENRILKNKYRLGYKTLSKMLRRNENSVRRKLYYAGYGVKP